VAKNSCRQSESKRARLADCRNLLVAISKASLLSRLPASRHLALNSIFQVAARKPRVARPSKRGSVTTTVSTEVAAPQRSRMAGALRGEVFKTECAVNTSCHETVVDFTEAS
jgi:hypothetical protein